MEDILPISKKISKHVVDPFLGSGAFAIPAVKLGRYFIGIDIDKETLDNASKILLVK
jgi:DNA modification methylase